MLGLQGSSLVPLGQLSGSRPWCAGAFPLLLGLPL